MDRVRPSLSARTRQELRLLGDELKAARLERRMTQEALAERLGVSRYTVMALERGAAGVALGIAVEAMGILGLSSGSTETRADATRRLLRALPARGRSRTAQVRDDF
jgi:transcriptional regulator with XRE-family HTH domain